MSNTFSLWTNKFCFIKMPFISNAISRTIWRILIQVFDFCRLEIMINHLNRKEKSLNLVIRALLIWGVPYAAILWTRILNLQNRIQTLNFRLIYDSKCWNPDFLRRPAKYKTRLNLFQPQENSGIGASIWGWRL